MNTTTGTSTDEVTRYLADLRAALADLPPGERDGLLEDLPEHLAEVAAEAPGSLADRLGPPAAYAAELRAAAGLRPGPADGGGPAVGSAVQRLVALADRVDRGTGRVIGYPKATEFLVLLRPAWWLLRGYLAALLLLRWYAATSLGLVPRVGGSAVAGLVVIVVCVLASVRLGRSAHRFRPWLRVAVILLNVVLAVFGLMTLNRVRDLGDVMVLPQVYDPYSGVTDLYPYGPDGRPLTGVEIRDQNGDVLRLGDPGACQTGPVAGADTYRYPLCGAPPPNVILVPQVQSTTAPPVAPSASPSG